MEVTKSLESKNGSISYLFASFYLILINLSLALILNNWVNPSFFDISLTCDSLNIVFSLCSLKAKEVGMISIIGISVSTYLSYFFLKKIDLKNKKNSANVQKIIIISKSNAEIFFFIMCLVISILYGFDTYHDFGTIYSNRNDDILGKANLIKITNLIWPLIMQLIFSIKNKQLKFGYLILLILCIKISPFRGTFFIALLFLILIFYRDVNLYLQQINQSKNRITLFISILILTMLSLGALKYIQETRSRISSLNNASITTKSIQRIVFPLYQAAFAENISEINKYPNYISSLKSKFRLDDSQNMNQKLYTKIYNSKSGETTSLFYGESFLISASQPIYWIIIAPLFLFFGAIFFLKYLNIDATVLFAIALWRSSLGGLLDILPSLLIQLTIYLYIVRFCHKNFNFSNLSR